MGKRRKPLWLAVAAVAMILALLWFLFFGWADDSIWVVAVVFVVVGVFLLLVRAARSR